MGGDDIVTVSLCDGGLVYTCFVTSNCSEALYCCTAFIER